MAVAFVQAHTPGNNKVAGTTGTWSTIAAVPAGNLLVCGILFDNATVASKPAVSSISVPSGETASWVFLGAARSTSTSGGAFSSGELWAIKTTVIWPTSTTITFTLDTSVTMKAAAALEFSGADAALRDTPGTAYSTTTTPANATSTGTTPSVGDLALGMAFHSNTTTPPPADASADVWTQPGLMGSSGGSGATNNTGNISYRILISTGHANYVCSAGTTAGNGSIVAILRQTPPKVSPTLEAKTFGTFTGINPGDTIDSVIVQVTQLAATANIGRMTVRLWDGATAQIGTDQLCTATAAVTVDTFTFTGVTYAQLADLRVRFIASQSAAAPGEFQRIDSVSLAVNYTPAAGAAGRPPPARQYLSKPAAAGTVATYAR